MTARLPRRRKIRYPHGRADITLLMRRNRGMILFAAVETPSLVKL